LICSDREACAALGPCGECDGKERPETKYECPKCHQRAGLFVDPTYVHCGPCREVMVPVTAPQAT